jgi:ketosteroid isomerase-like protein
MAADNVDVVRRLYEALAEGGHGSGPPPGLLHPDVEYVNPDGAIEPGVRRGAAAFAQAVERLYEGWSSWEMEPERFAAAGDRIAVVLRYRGVARASGIEVQGRESALVTVRDGFVIRYEWFHGPDDALRALDLAP